MTNHEKSLRISICLFIIFSIIAFHAANNIIWLSQNDSIQGCGVPLHLLRQLSFFNASSHIANMRIPFTEKFQRCSWLLRYSNPSWSPVVSILPSVANSIFGKTTEIGIFFGIVNHYIITLLLFSQKIYCCPIYFHFFPLLTLIFRKSA